MKKIFVLAAILFTIASCTRRQDIGPIYNPYVFEDDFNNNSNNWNFADGTNQAYGVISNGTFKIDYNDDKFAAYYVSQQLGFRTNQDFIIESRIGSNNNMGLLFGFNDQNNAYGYSLTIDYDGKYAVYDEGGNGNGTDIQTIVSPTAHTAVRPNGDWNAVKIQQRGNQWIGYINGVQVFQIASQRMIGTGVGFVVVPKTQGEADYIYVSGYY